MKIVSMYLPQFHQIKENDEWWGEGYTEWSAVRNARKFFKNHDEPRVPLNNNYYDLSDKDATAWKWQAELASEYGVYGFAIYHYWFKTGEQLLEKPMEILLRHKEIDIKYCICWANETWRRTWYGERNEVLKKQEYGGISEWINHFNYMLQFFLDDRYIMYDNKPVICIYRTFEIRQLKEMIEIWNTLAKENGFSGVYVISGNTGGVIDDRYEIIDAYYNYEPGHTYTHSVGYINKIPMFLEKVYKKVLNRFTEKERFEKVIASKIIYDNNTKKLYQGNKKCYLGTFVGYDDTPRRQNKGVIYDGTVEEFAANIKKISRVLKENNRQDDFVFVTAWNEWGEGAYLEPDETNGYAYLKALKAAVDEVNS